MGPTEFDSKGTETVTIASLAAGGIVNLVAPLVSFHYGSPLPTAGSSGSLNNIPSKYSGGIDMRAGVGHITRKVRIYGTNEDGLGGHI